MNIHANLVQPIQFLFIDSGKRLHILPSFLNIHKFRFYHQLDLQYRHTGNGRNNKFQSSFHFLFILIDYSSLLIRS
jgi:hypothetical protein